MKVTQKVTQKVTGISNSGRRIVRHPSLPIATVYRYLSNNSGTSLSNNVNQLTYKRLAIHYYLINNLHLPLIKNNQPRLLEGDCLELYIARDKLSHRGGDRKSKEYQRDKCPIEFSWEQYCESIRLEKHPGQIPGQARDCCNWFNTLLTTAKGLSGQIMGMRQGGSKTRGAFLKTELSPMPGVENKRHPSVTGLTMAVMVTQA